MKYMVMEVHYSYAVVLDEEGHFIKVANRHYEAGQMVDDIIEMQETENEIVLAVPVQKKSKRWLRTAISLAACFVLFFSVNAWRSMATFASVYMSINPSVRIDVNRKDMVVGISGVNADGQELLEGYSYKKKDLDLVMDELVDRAVEMDFLTEGGAIKVTVDGKNQQWMEAEQTHIETHLNEYLQEKMSVTIQVQPAEPGKDPALEGISDYDDTDYGPSPEETEWDEGKTDYTDGATDYDDRAEATMDDHDTDYGPDNDGVTDYNDTDYGPNKEGVTDYEEPEAGDSDYRESQH